MPFEFREAWLAAAVEYLPDFAVHGYRWGRTDASVPEPGAYLVAGILVPLFVLFLWGMFRMASTQSAVSRPDDLVSVKRQLAESTNPSNIPPKEELQASVRGHRSTIPV